MQIITILILLIIYTISISGFLGVLLTIFQIDYSSFELSILLSFAGVGLGLILYSLSKLKMFYKTLVILTILFVILSLILITYFVYGDRQLIELLVNLIKFGFFFSISTIPAVSLYTILKKQRNAFITSGISILFFYFFILLLSKIIPVITVPYYSSDQIASLLLFFILFILYLEIGLASMLFDSIKSKMIPNKDIDESMLKKFNQVFNRYLLQVPTLIFIFYFCSIVLFYYSGIMTNQEIMSIRLNSSLGIFILIFLSLLGAFIFWLLIPREKMKNV